MSIDHEAAALSGGTEERTEQERDAVRGSLFGGAVGDALGYPVEFLSWGSIRSRYGEEGIQAYSLDRRTGLAVISDDTQMMLFTVCGLLQAQTRMRLGEENASYRDHVRRAYLDWYGTQSGHMPKDGSVSWILTRRELFALRAPGNTCMSALENGGLGTLEKPYNNSKGCGTVMRTAPLGLLGPRMDEKGQRDLGRAAAEIAAITHGHPMADLSCTYLSQLIRLAAYRRELGLREACEQALAFTGELFGDDPSIDELHALTDRALTLTENNASDVDNIHSLGGGWRADDALAIGLYCAVKYERDFNKAITVSVNHSGDSDSTGIIVGNILGARLGYEALDEKWKRSLEMGDLILELADDLAQGCPAGEPDAVWKKKYAFSAPFQNGRFVEAD